MHTNAASVRGTWKPQKLNPEGEVVWVDEQESLIVNARPILHPRRRLELAP